MTEVESNSDFVLMPWDDKREIVLTELNTNEIKQFFQENGILSTIRNLSLQLRELVPRLKLLKTSFNGSIKLHQVQIASLLANAFLCTFPKGTADCPSINFNTLYESNSNSVMGYNLEKIKCIINYFSRIHKKQPMGYLSFHRLCIPDRKFPRWDRTTAELSYLKVDSTEKIEDQDGYLQVDFANRYIGGGVLGRGCVQEEIRFIICPELIVARLFTESLADNEAMFVVGAERFCRYTGYSGTFKFAGDYEDETPRDENGHRKSFLIIVDALCFNQFSEQFRESKILRELKKAYVGFKPMENTTPLPLATGNWGCGAFGGDPQLKALLQLMASSQARRNVLYLTFGDVALKRQIDETYKLLKENTVNVGKLYRILRLYNRERKKNQSVFDFVRETLGENSTSAAPSTIFTSSKDNPGATEENVSPPKLKQLENETREGDSSYFSDLVMDFDLVEAEIQNHLKSSSASGRGCGSSRDNSTGSDRIWFENEVHQDRKTAKRQIEQEDVEMANSVSPDSFTEGNEISKDIVNSQELAAVQAELKSPTSAQEMMDSEQTDGKNIAHEKKLVQKKITDCFFRK
ncbi:hypothetical protein RUM44_002576 [Polyplax serrata]|uniref:poly(ADP-ribose) glycohydrolase n=1 Tax=Polyplax serrata TaxID=468196 RepID=A0ABR1AF58_POLSC